MVVGVNALSFLENLGRDTDRTPDPQPNMNVCVRGRWHGQVVKAVWALGLRGFWFKSWFGQQVPSKQKKKKKKSNSVINS